MSDEQAFQQAIHTLQETINQMERQVVRLGNDLQLLVGTGDVELVRRGPTGETVRPKVVVAELKGCDPMLWRPEHPAWMRAVVPGRGRPEVPAKGGNGQPPSDDDDDEDDGERPPEPQADAPEEN